MSASDILPDTATEYVEWALEKAGGAGKFQYVHLVALGLCWTYSSALTYLGIFTGQAAEVMQAGEAVPFVCDTMQVSQISNTDESYIANFQLVCDTASLAPLLQTLFFFGYMLGLLVWGSISDKYGRRAAFYLPLLIQQVGVLGQVIPQQYWQLAVARVITGFGNAGFGLTSFMWQSEMLGIGIRGVTSWLPNLFFALGQILLSPLGFFVPNWRTQTLIMLFVGCAFFLLAGIVYESPKWLASMGRGEEAHQVLCACARMNGNPDPPAPPAAFSSKGSSVSLEDKPSVFQLLDRRLLGRFLTMCFAWFAISLGFYGLSLNAAKLPLTIYWSNIVVALTTIPAYLLGGILIELPRCGRRGAVSGGFWLAGVCLLVSVFVSEVALTILYYVASAGASLSFAVLYVWAAELFPTDIRGVSMGIQSVSARVGAMLAPFVAAAGDKNNQTIPLILFAIPCLISGMTTLMLPETLGKPLPGTLADLDAADGETEPLVKKSSA